VKPKRKQSTRATGPQALDRLGRQLAVAIRGIVLATLREKDGTLQVVRDRAAEVLTWVRAHGGRTTPAEVATFKVAGLRSKAVALRLLQALADRGMGMLSRGKASNGRTTEIFTATPAK
jgi:hypothetical protein